MNLQSLLLDKYPMIESVTIERNQYILHITDTTAFNQILEKCAINFIEYGNFVSFYKFGVFSISCAEINHEKVFISKYHLESVMKNLLL